MCSGTSSVNEIGLVDSIWGNPAIPKAVGGEKTKAQRAVAGEGGRETGPFRLYRTMASENNVDIARLTGAEHQINRLPTGNDRGLAHLLRGPPEAIKLVPFAIC